MVTWGRGWNGRVTATVKGDGAQFFDRWDVSFDHWDVFNKSDLFHSPEKLTDRKSTSSPLCFLHTVSGNNGGDGGDGGDWKLTTTTMRMMVNRKISASLLRWSERDGMNHPSPL
ncbi:hypothetical protein QVD17_38919 [Tagetes erecta]|uniref:Uncharacterized protein n=1 Tax=Tagetes erecta TaxID=13708 RepID=A0AAD8JT18_TARER|nr:hypothetical protein QVD17_38919 [Tagetes erecta]